MAGVDLHGLITVCEEWSLLLRAGRSVGRNVGLQPTKQGCRLGGFGRLKMQIRSIGADRREGELQLAYVPAEIGEEPIVDQGLGDIVRSPRHWNRVDSVATNGDSHAGPEGGGGVGQPQVDVAMLSERGEHEQVVGVKPGGAEDRQSFRKVAVLGRDPQPG